MTGLDFRKGLRRVCTSAAALLLAASTLVFNNSAMAQSSSNVPGWWPLPPGWWPFPPWWPTGPGHDHKPPCVPEFNSGLVLIPVVIAVLLFASRQLLRRRDAQKQ